MQPPQLTARSSSGCFYQDQINCAARGCQFLTKERCAKATDATRPTTPWESMCQSTRKGINMITAITPLDFSPISRLRDLKITKLAWLLNALAQRCTSWCHELRSWVQTLSINQRGIMCLLVGVLFGVQVSCWKVRQQLVYTLLFWL